jgi:hypothetical protein
MFYRVTAKTLQPDRYWRSNIMSGHSIDNLSPDPPGGGSLSVLKSGIRVRWQENGHDSDAKQYIIYRSSTSGFTPDDSTRLIATCDTVYLDTTVQNAKTYYYILRTEDIHGNMSIPTSEMSLTFTLVHASGEIPLEFGLEQNFPNPFNPSTTIQYGLPKRSSVTLVIFNALGQRVSTLVSENQEAGYHEVRFDGRNLPSGVYFYELTAGTFVETKKLLLLR